MGEVWHKKKVNSIHLWIHIDNFSVPLILEQDPILIIRNDLKIWGRVARTCLSFPVVKAHI
jgi:hypothetical protein